MLSLKPPDRADLIPFVVMATDVAFLRAINVGGRVVKMDQLRQLFTTMELANVKTFIASGNVIFESATRSSSTLEKRVAGGLQKALGYGVGTFIRTAEEVADVAAHEPFKSSELRKGTLFIGFLEETLNAQQQKLVAAMRTPTDDLAVHKREIYWLSKTNFSNAQFSPAKMEKALAMGATFRNSSTVRRIAALVGA
jgi:uncharacterized protein (DUF1697 family)